MDNAHFFNCDPSLTQSELGIVQQVLNAQKCSFLMHPGLVRVVTNIIYHAKKKLSIVSFPSIKCLAKHFKQSLQPVTAILGNVKIKESGIYYVTSDMLESVLEQVETTNVLLIQIASRVTIPTNYDMHIYFDLKKKIDLKIITF